MLFSELVAQLSRQLSLPNLAPGDTGACAIRFDDLVVHFQNVPAARAFDVSCPLGRVAPRDKPAMQRLLEGREGAGPYCSEAGQVFMRRRFYLQAMSFPNFFKALERFINDADHWRDRLRPSGLELS